MVKFDKGCSNVTSVCDDGEQEKAHKTFIFTNRSLHHCFYNNRGYCRFRDTCRYQHFNEICLKTICKDSQCKRRHPVFCKYKENCKFNKSGICAYKHSEDDKDKDVILVDEINHYIKDIEMLKKEIKDMEDVINEKENYLTILTKENNDQLNIIDSLKALNEELKSENRNLKDKLTTRYEKIQPDDTKSQTKSGKLEQNNVCEKCCIKFLSKETLKIHKKEMHKAVLKF